MPLAILIAWLVVGAAVQAWSAELVTWTHTRQVGPFVIQANFDLAKYDKLFSELPDLQRELVRTLGIRPASSAIDVYLFSAEEQFREYTEHYFPNVPFRPALYVRENGQPGVYTYLKPDLDIDLRHECTHALLHASLADVPLWLDEGLAKYFEMPAAQRAFDHPYFDDAKWKWSLRLGMVRSIESLEQRTELADMDASDYRYSWAWVHFMLHGPEAAHRELVHYLAGRESVSSSAKLSSQVANAVPNASEKLAQHFKHWQK
ncbi:MAG: hypothetical protein IT425_07385 [Pirellulales bacterium]|nr:hypothetical protein [Pirellulales bacterium]